MNYAESDRGFVPQVDPDGALPITYARNPRDFKVKRERVKLPQIVRVRRVVGRNEVCPFCSSGIKFKKCHGKPAAGDWKIDGAAGHSHETPALFSFTPQPSLDSAPFKHKEK